MKAFKKIIPVAMSLALLAALPISAAANAPGDVSGDGEVTAEDARLCLRQAVGLESYAPGSTEFKACDVTYDSEVSAEDARLILRAAVGLETLADPEPGPVDENEYDIYRSGTFYLTGTMSDSSGSHPVEIAKKDDLLYMLSDMEGQQIAMQMIGKDVYLIHPGKNAYFKMDQATLSLMGMDIDDLMADVHMDELPALSEANSVTPSTLDGRDCTVYTFLTADGSRIQIYMDGSSFLGMDNFTSDWVRTESIRITYITANLPAKVTTPGGGGRRTLLLTTFMGYFM